MVPVFENVGGTLLLKTTAMLNVLPWIVILIIAFLNTTRNVASFLISMMVSGLLDQLISSDSCIS